MFEGFFQDFPHHPLSPAQSPVISLPRQLGAAYAGRYLQLAERGVMGFFIHGCSVGSGSGLGYGV